MSKDVENLRKHERVLNHIDIIKINYHLVQIIK